MTNEEIAVWDRTKCRGQVDKVTNLAWSWDFGTVGAVTGDNIYLHGARYSSIKKGNIIHWHGVSFKHMFQTDSMCVEPLSGGGVSPVI